jgi:hypothetical protein
MTCSEVADNIITTTGTKLGINVSQATPRYYLVFARNLQNGVSKSFYLDLDNRDALTPANLKNIGLWLLQQLP